MRFSPHWPWSNGARSALRSTTKQKQQRPVGRKLEVPLLFLPCMWGANSQSPLEACLILLSRSPGVFPRAVKCQHYGPHNKWIMSQSWRLGPESKIPPGLAPAKGFSSTGASLSSHSLLGVWTQIPGVTSIHIRMPVPHSLNYPLKALPQYSVTWTLGLQHEMNSEEGHN